MLFLAEKNKNSNNNNDNNDNIYIYIDRIVISHIDYHEFAMLTKGSMFVQLIRFKAVAARHGLGRRAHGIISVFDFNLELEAFNRAYLTP